MMPPHRPVLYFSPRGVAFTPVDSVQQDKFVPDTRVSDALFHEDDDRETRTILARRVARSVVEVTSTRRRSWKHELTESPRQRNMVGNTALTTILQGKSGRKFQFVLCWSSERSNVRRQVPQRPWAATSSAGPVRILYGAPRFFQSLLH